MKNRIESVSPYFIFYIVLRHPVLFFSALKWLKVVFVKFFFYQFQTKFKLKKRNIVNVDHPYDNAIPFDSSYVEKYLGFMHMVFQTMGFYYKEFGVDSVQDMKQYFHDLHMLYDESGDIYNRCQSTTVRPPVFLNYHFIKIHALDPHLHCVPSLHVMVVIYNWMKINELLYKRGKEEIFKNEIAYTYKEAVEITESVLHIKQHSINCISAALFVMTAKFDGFTADISKIFVEDLFIGDKDRINALSEIRSYILDTYSSLLDEHKEEIEHHYKDVIINFLEKYDDGLLTETSFEGNIA